MERRASSGAARRIILALLVSSLAVPALTFAQGESAVPFLLIAPNARADGMGESGAGLADDVGAVHWNPGGLAFLTGQELSITHSNWLPQFGQSDLFYEYLNYRNHVPEWGGTISASVTYLNLGEFNRTLNDPTVLETFKAFELAVTGGYATQLMANLGLGVNLRFIYSSLAPFGAGQEQGRGVGSTVSFDIGAMYKPQFTGFEERIGIGVNLTNLGPKISYIDIAQADPLPTNLRVGLSFKAIQTEFNNLSVNTDFSRLLVRRYRVPVDSAGQSIGDAPPPDNFYKAIFTSWSDGGLKKVTVGAGLEYWYGKPRLLALRYGYFYEHPEYGNRKFHTFGAGIRYDMYGFDFSYLSPVEENHPLAETLRFTLLISWSGGE